MSKSGSSITIGIFDGIHIGHRRLIAKAVSQKPEDGEAVMLTFEYPPEYYFKRNDKFHGMIYTGKKRKKLALSLGIDRIEFLDFLEIKDMYANEFVELLKKKYMATSVTVGFNFRFGKDKGGNTSFLSNRGKKLGFKTSIIPPILYSGHKVSSTLIRHYLRNGEIGHANEILCKPYSMCGILSKTDDDDIFILNRRNQTLLAPCCGLYLAVNRNLDYFIVNIKDTGNSEHIEILNTSEKNTDIQNYKEFFLLETISLTNGKNRADFDKMKKEIDISKKLIEFWKNRNGWWKDEIQ